MASKAQQSPAVTTFLAERWEQNAKKLADLGEALPDGKLEWTPASGVRSYGGVLRHVAFWNQYVADSLNGKQADDAANELPIQKYVTRAKVIEALRRTSQDVAAAIRAQAGGEAKAVELAVKFIEHNCEHYGQLAVYARLLGVVPPESRG